MDLAAAFKKLEKLTVDNSPAILTAAGIVGTLTTAYLVGKATFKAAEVIEEETHRQNERDQVAFLTPLTTRQAFDAVWKLYIPSAVAATVTVASIFAANHVNSRRAAGMAAAYSLSERAFSEYREKVIDKVGEKKERAYRDEIAQDQVRRDPVNDNSVIITDNGDVLCYDHFTGRYFKSSMEALRSAENDVNQMIINHGYASVSDLYEMLNLPATSFSDEVGWNTDRMLKLVFSTTMSTDNRPCISIDFDLHPNRKYAHFAGES